ncbi:alpha-ketoacid dehydrogenase subunit alpha/beta [Ekhidna sp.]|uniref:alpha-ketoacid dehydrogenase subunit alpha/beta n=1 Tax=Ekhidna sp. TaxID=2608089 RepID=UPI003C7CC4BE
MAKTATAPQKKKDSAIDWKEIALKMLISRAMDDLEENKLVPEKKVLYQFSARGHELGQLILAHLLDKPKDSASAYYRSRPLMIGLGLSVEDALSAPLTRSGGYSDGRDIGVVCNMPKSDRGCVVLPMAGDVGSQYTPAIGWAQSIEYHAKTLKDKSYKDSISAILGGDGSVATNGFWSALTIATTQKLPVLFYIEDNGYGISVTSEYQTPGKNIAENLASFKNLDIWDGSGTDPDEAYKLLKAGTDHVRSRKGPALVRLTVPRLNGHSYQDNQAYKDEKLVKKEQANDPLKAMQKMFSEKEWKGLEKEAQKIVDESAEAALNRPAPDASKIKKFVFSESDEIQGIGGLRPSGHAFPASSEEPKPDKRRINIGEAINLALDYELKTNPKVLVFGEDVGMKGGVHAVTMGLQSKYGEDRVFDTSLSEEGIIGRAVGMAYAGLMPVAEIQFRKYADPAMEQLNNCGTTRWRTANRFAAPIVVRMPGGFAKVGDPWHSVTNEVMFAHAIGWQVAFPSNAQDAVGLIRSAMRSDNPTMFFEHRNLNDNRYARRPYPGDEFFVPFGKANLLREGTDITLVTWGAMCEACESAVEEIGISADVLDLRTIMPWDKEAVLNSIKKTNKCLIVHEDALTAGFGAEIAAVLASEGFNYLDAPVERIAMPDIPLPHNVPLMESVVPNAERIGEKMKEILAF